MYFSAIIAALSLLPAAVQEGHVTDVFAQDTIASSSIVADKGLIVSKTDTIPIRQGFSVSETLLQSTSLYVGETGGAAGQKNISFRGLGSAHTSVYIDGVKIGNVQSGQGDLTNLGAELFTSAIIDYAQNSVSFISARPDFRHGHAVAGQASLSAGSFGTTNPCVRLDFRLGKDVSLSAGAAGLVSEGDFKYGDGTKRDNNDIRQISGSIDVFGHMDTGTWHMKAHYNGSDRGLPGSVYWPSADRQTDRNAYLHGYLENRFSGVYSLASSVRYAFDRMDYFSQWGLSRYDQREIRVNAAHKYKAAGWLDLFLATDFTWDKLSSTSCCAERFAPTASLGAAFRAERFKADIAVEYVGTMDNGSMLGSTVSPSADVRVPIAGCLDLTAFGRRAYRIPTFNELYYEGYGNPELKPEDAFLGGIGLAYRKKSGRWTLKASADGFVNLLKDKIVSAPSQADPYLWLPYNIGKVRSLGAELGAGLNFAKGLWAASAGVKYSYQSSTDRTPGSGDFGKQIPYVSRHTVSIDGGTSCKGWTISLWWNLRAGRRDSYGELPDWSTLDVKLAKNLRFKSCGPLECFIAGKNLTDCRYDSISGYPMPGLSVTGGFGLKF